MSENQGHGKAAEYWVANAMSARLSDEHTSKFDMFAEDGMAISCKCIREKDSTVPMSSAIRFLSMDCDYKLIVAYHKQVSETHKQVVRIEEYTIDAASHKKILGRALASEAVAFNHAISLSAVPCYREARKIARKMKLAMNESGLPAIKFNPKIDSKCQRRLQCSVVLSELRGIVAPTVHTDTFYGQDISQAKIPSPPRQRSKFKSASTPRI